MRHQLQVSCCHADVVSSNCPDHPVRVGDDTDRVWLELGSEGVGLVGAIAVDPDHDAYLLADGPARAAAS